MNTVIKPESLYAAVFSSKKKIEFEKKERKVLNEILCPKQNGGKGVIKKYLSKIRTFSTIRNQRIIFYGLFEASVTSFLKILTKTWKQVCWCTEIRKKGRDEKKYHE